jgi:hypothetical protein
MYGKNQQLFTFEKEIYKLRYLNLHLYLIVNHLFIFQIFTSFQWVINYLKN